jgi:hypothetical protein
VKGIYLSGHALPERYTKEVLHFIFIYKQACIVY